MRFIFSIVILLISINLFSNTNQTFLNNFTLSFGHATSWISHSYSRKIGTVENRDRGLNFESVGGYSIGVSFVNNPNLQNKVFILEPGIRYTIRGYQLNSSTSIPHGVRIRIMEETKLSYIEPNLKVRLKLNISNRAGVFPFLGIGVSMLTKAETATLHQPPLTTSVNYGLYDIFFKIGSDFYFTEKYFTGFEYSRGAFNILRGHNIITDSSVHSIVNSRMQNNSLIFRVGMVL